MLLLFPKAPAPTIPTPQAELDVAAALLKQQDPRPLRLDPSDPTQRQSLTPVPERMWALRNVANGMVRFGDSSKVGGLSPD